MMSGMPEPGDFPRLLLSTSDVDELTRVGSAVFSPHRLVYRGTNALLSAVELDRISVVTMRYHGDSTVVTTEQLGYYAVHVPVAGRGAVRFREDEFGTAPNTAAVFNPEDRPAMRWSSDLHQFGVKIPVAALERHLAVLAARPVLRGPVFGHRAPDALATAWCALARTAAQLAAAGEPPERVAARLEEAFLTALLLGQPHDWSDRLLAEPRKAPATAVAEAIEQIEADPAADWSLARLADVTGVSVRSLQEGFRRREGTTPSAYVRDARLRLARRLLLDEDAPVRGVTEVAFLAGFTHLGRFASSFREAYGVLPSQLSRSALLTRSARIGRPTRSG